MSDINYKDMGERIKTRRKEKKLSQQKLAELVGLEYRTLLKWEKGDLNHKIDLPVFLKLCDVLEIDVPFLLGHDYSTKELETVCTYTGLSEKTAKTLHNSSNYIGSPSELLSDLIDNYDNFPLFLDALEDFLIASYLSYQAAANYKEKGVDFRDSVMQHIRQNDKSAVMLLQCQRLIDGLKDDVMKDEYIKHRAERHQTGYASIITEKK